MILSYMTSFYPFTPDDARQISVFLMTLTSFAQLSFITEPTLNLLVSTNHNLLLLLPSAYNKQKIPLLEETVHSPSCVGLINLS